MKVTYGCNVDAEASLPDCIIIDSSGAAWQRDRDGWWCSGVVQHDYPGLSTLEERRGPLVMLHKETA